MLSADEWEAQLEADLIAEKWPDEERGFAPWQQLGPQHQDIKDRCLGIRTKEQRDLTKE